MPRTGDVYSAPAGTKGIPDTTIQSNQYNTFIDDLVADANAARPIVAGGTGANTATEARENIGALASADILAAPTKAVPVDNDTIVILDSEASGALKRVLKSFFTNASNMNSGTVPDARLPAQLQAAASLVTNLDTIVATGSYRHVAGATGQPVNLSGYVDHVQFDAAAMYQIWTVAGGGTTQYIRVKAASAWGAWERYYGTKAKLDLLYQAALGFTPVTEGNVANLATDRISIGWRADATLGLRVGVTDFNANWPINITGTASNANLLGGTSMTAINTALAARPTRDNATVIGFSSGNIDIPYLRHEGTGIAESLISARNIGLYMGAAIAAMNTGALGTYAFMLCIPNANINPGVGLNGSDLAYSNAAGDAVASGSGSCRCMGVIRAGGTVLNRTTLVLRYA